MDTIAHSNPAFQVVREPAGLSIRVPVKTDRFRSLLNLVWVLIWAAVEGAIVLHLLGAFGPPETPPSFPLPLTGLFLGIFGAAGGLVCWRWVWGLGGREIFRVEADALVARREIWGIGHTRSFDLERLRSLGAGRLNYQVHYPSWGRMFIGHGEGEIVVDHAGRTFAYGKGLEEAEARDLVDLLEDEIAFRRRNPRRLAPRTAFLR